MVIVVRDALAVARSFAARAADPDDYWLAENDHRRAIELWNGTLEAARDFSAEPSAGSRLLLVGCDRLGGGDRTMLGQLYRFLGLPPRKPMTRELARMATAAGQVPLPRR